MHTRPDRVAGVAAETKQGEGAVPLADGDLPAAYQAGHELGALGCKGELVLDEGSRQKLACVHIRPRGRGSSQRPFRAEV